MAGRSNFPFQDIRSAALSYIDSLLRAWLPHGKREGHEYKSTNPLRADNKAGSFSVNLNTGAWADFATDDKGGDLVSLWAYLHGLKQREAAIEVADQIGYQLPDELRPKEKIVRQQQIIDPDTVKKKSPRESSEWSPVLPVPYDAGEPPKAHVKRGLPEMVWAYKDAKGRVLGYIYRFKTSDGGKETLPVVWGHSEKLKKEEWRWMQFPVPRPLYGLDRLAAKPDAWVLLVEGEKCADAAVDLLPNAAIVTWPGGSKAVEKVDWSPLAGRKIFIWPDCDFKREILSKKEIEANIDPLSKPVLAEHDQPGVKAMLLIRDQILAIDPETQIHFVDIPKPGDKPDGWDIADGIAQGMDAEALTAFISRHRDPAPVVAQQSAPAVDSEDMLYTPSPASAEDDDEWRELLSWDKGKVEDTRENVFIFLNRHPDLKDMVAFDKFSMRIVKRRPAPWDIFHEDAAAEWSDNDTLELSLWLKTMNGYTVRSLDTINQAVKLIASRNAFDPLIDYLNSLVWDGTKRMSSWLNKYAGAEQNDYAARVGVYFLISMVARAYKPGCIMRAMPVFEGQQFRGKSSIARILGGEWFSDSSLDLRGKDGFISIHGTWLHEIPELGSFNKQDDTVIKAYLSSAVDRYRSPFDKFARDWPRRTVFFGTTNEDEYLRDKTGNTRFWPIRTEVVGTIDLDGLAQARDQLFAEAVHFYKKGQRYHPTADEQEKLFKPEQTLREHEDPWEIMIIEWLYKGTFAKVNVTEVLIDCLKVEPGKTTQHQSSQVGKILTRLGWKKGRPVTEQEDGGKDRIRYYFRPKADLPASSAGNNMDGDDDSIPF